MVEEFIEGNELLCLNDGTGTRLDVTRGKESVVDITLATRAIANKCKWEGFNRNSISSDHFSIFMQLEVKLIKVNICREGR